jgi:hypothetical protein
MVGRCVSGVAFALSRVVHRGALRAAALAPYINTSEVDVLMPADRVARRDLNDAAPNSRRLTASVSRGELGNEFASYLRIEERELEAGGLN